MDYRKQAKIIIDEFSEVFDRIDTARIGAFIEKIKKANKVILIGVGREGLATKAFCMRLMHLGIESHWIWDTTTPALERGDLLIATSGSGAIGHIDYVVETAKQRGADAAVITGDPGGRTAQKADLVLFVPASVYLGKAEVVPSVQPMGNLFEQCLFVLFDMIIMDMREQMGVAFEQMEARHRNLE